MLNISLLTIKSFLEPLRPDVSVHSFNVFARVPTHLNNVSLQKSIHLIFFVCRKEEEQLKGCNVC